MIKTVSPSKLITVGLVGAMVAIATFYGLRWLSQPGSVNAAVSIIENRLRAAPKLAKASFAQARWPVGSICRDLSERTADAMALRIGALADENGVKVEDPTLVVDENARPPKLTEVTVLINGQGSYDSAMNFLSRMAKEQPAIFARSLDMKPVKGGVIFELKGAFWCASV